MSEVKRLVGEVLEEIISSAKSGGPTVRVGLMASGSEHGSLELCEGGRLAQRQLPGLKVVMIGPKSEGYDDLEWIETDDCEADVAKALEEALKTGKVQGAVALHYPFPIGVTTIGRALTPGRGRDMLLASTTGTSATNRNEAMVRNALLGIAAAKALGKLDPTVGILNVDGAPTVHRALKKLEEKGYAITWGKSLRADGGAVLRGNDILAGAVDVCVTDTLTGNVLSKVFSSFSTGGSIEATGWGYGPSAGEGWPHVVSIISRASGAPVIAGALCNTAEAVKGDLPGKVAAEMKAAKTAGLDEVLIGLQPKAAEAAEEVKAPPAEPTDEEIHGIDVLDLEDAVKALWAEGIYAESAMGCTGPVVKLPARHEEKARKILADRGYI